MSSFRVLILVALLAAACSKSPTPSGVFLSLSVSATDVAVATRVNGEANDHLSSKAREIVASAPVNAALKDAGNEISFRLTRSDELADGETFAPWFLAALEIGVKGEAIEEESAHERLIFQRQLRADEVKALLAGEEVVVTETFDLSRDRLKELKADATMAPKTEAPAAAGHH